MTDWQRMKLGDLCPFVYGKSLPSTVRDEAGVISVYGSNGVVGKHSEACVFEPGVIVGRKGSVGEVHFSSANFWPIDTAFYVVGSSKCDVGFAYYLLKSLDLKSMNSDSAIPGLNRDAAHSLNVSVPPLAEQRAISEVLGALDDKIESNRRLVETAKDFIDALFWTAFSDGEMNLPVSSLAEVVDCLHTKKPEQALDGKQLLQLSNISDDGFLILGNHYPISLDDYVKWTANIEAREGDVVLTNVGRVGALARIPSGVRAALGRNMTAIRARKSSDALFIFAALNNPQVRRGLKSLIDVGTIMDALNVHAIRRILLPDSTALQRDNFALSIGDLVERCEVAVKESRDLDNLRDALLPELLSGRLLVKDAESMMENV